MSRFLPVANGRLFVSFDESHLLSELTWPYVGLENHVGGNGFRLGLFFSGKFVWVNSSHIRKRRYRSGVMVSEASLFFPELGGLECVLTDWVDLDIDVHFRRVELINSPADNETVTFFLPPEFFHQPSGYW